MNYVIITGGTSLIGEQIIYNLGAKANIIFTYNKSLNKSKSIKKNFKKISKNKIISFKLDLNNEKNIFNFYKFIKNKKLNIISFVHNAFESFKRKDFVNINPLKAKKYLMTNCYGSFLLTQYATKLIKASKNDNKSLLFISTQSTEYGGFKLSPYSASKGFLNSLSASLSKELGKDLIRTNVLSLGKFNTKKLSKNFNYDKKKIIEDIPFGRLGTPKDVSTIVSNLVFTSPYLSGAIIKLSGGR